MANNKIKFRYGICQNSHMEETGKPCPLCQSKQIQKVIATKDLVCSECKEKLKEIPRPKTFWEKYGTPVIIAAVVLLIGGGFCIYSLLSGSKGPQKINLVQKELTMKVGETQVITPTVEPEGEKATFIFKPQGKIVKATSGGEITALKKGETTIIVKCEENPEIRAICKVTIEDRDTTPPPTDTVLVKQLSIDGGDFSIKVGESKQLSYIVTPEKHDEILSWTSDNEAVATVDDTGKVSAVKEGTANIKIVADRSGVNTSVKVTVTKKPGGGGDEPPISPIERYGKYSGGRAKSNGYPDGTGKLTFTKSYQLNAQYTAQPGEYIQGIFENGKPTFVTYYQKDGTVTKIKLR
ncbi:MAG: hypothetical protein E7106_04155 [Prevotella sp.]|nr:hypothetical protein [Prevotella sp.]